MNTLNDILIQALVDQKRFRGEAALSKAMTAQLSPMTDFECSVMEDVFDFGEKAFGLNKYELIADGVLEPITRKFWDSKLD